jgi:hypothetical protein
MPWAGHKPYASAVVVEGFPGATIRDRLLNRRVSYKGRTSAHKIERQAIVRALKSTPFAIPISDEVAAKAVADAEGDALDALVLLVGSWIAHGLSADEWRQQLAHLNSSNASVEGWFPT